RAQSAGGPSVQGPGPGLLTGLRVICPADTRAFSRLASVQIRRELLDLARRHAGRPTAGPEAVEAALDERPAPEELELWCRFHQAVEALPADERETFSLVFYHAWTQARAAELLGASERTGRRGWAG